MTRSLRRLAWVIASIAVSLVVLAMGFCISPSRHRATRMLGCLSSFCQT
jgi:hypothetical protein